VAALLAEEDDPSLRMMGKLYADRVSSKLVIAGRSPTDLHQLERIVNAALAGPRSGRQNQGNHEPCVSPREARAPSGKAKIPLEILGSLLDFPELLADPEVEAALETLEGDTTLGVVAVRQNFVPEKGLAADEFLAQIPPSIHSFAAGRLAAPVFEGAREAKTELLENARKLKRLTLERENAAAVHQLQRGEAMGDAASEDALLREVQRRAREKHGLS
jgi:DNA primase